MRRERLLGTERTPNDGRSANRPPYRSLWSHAQVAVDPRLIAKLVRVGRNVPLAERFCNPVIPECEDHRAVKNHAPSRATDVCDSHITGLQPLHELGSCTSARLSRRRSKQRRGTSGKVDTSRVERRKVETKQERARARAHLRDSDVKNTRGTWHHR